MEQSNEITYRCCRLNSTKITTLIFGGGGVYGFLYLGMLKFLEEQNLLKPVQQVIGVSVGSMIALYLALGYTYQEIYKSVMYEIDLGRILEINADNIFNILDQLGINNGAYVEETIKNVIAAKGLSPYLTFRDLNELQLGPQLQIGYTRSFHNDFFVADRISMPDMPIWLAVRASIAIPIILTPVLDFPSQDILCDGGLVNNTPIKWYLEDWWTSKPGGHKDCYARIAPNTNSIKEFKNAQTQTLTQTDENIDLEQQSLDQLTHTLTDISHNQPTYAQTKLQQLPSEKYRQHFWCIEIKTLTNSPITHPDDLKSVSLPTYLAWVINKIFANQDASRDKYAKYLCQLDAKNYPEINHEKYDLDIPTRELILNRAYKEYKKYYNTQLLTTTNSN
jgi:hypothetical protein